MAKSGGKGSAPCPAPRSSSEIPDKCLPGLPVDIASSVGGLPAIWTDSQVCGRAYNVCSSAYIQTRRKRKQCFGMYAVAHTPIPTKIRLPMAPQGAQSARQGAQKRACARPQFAAWGVWPKRRRASRSCFLTAQLFARSKPICNRQLARAACERPRPPRISRNGSRTTARLPGGSVGSTSEQFNVRKTSVVIAPTGACRRAHITGICAA